LAALRRDQISGGPKKETIMHLMRWIVILAAVFIGSNARAEIGVKQISWSMLIDPDAQAFGDPFNKLSHEQLAKLAIVARAREQLKTSGLMEEDRKLAKERLASAEAALNADGIDIEGLLALRWIVAERRSRAASAGNGKLDGASVHIIGFLLPIGPDEQGTQIAYLVPELGMCSHTPPPPPNQLVRVRMTADWKPTRFYEPVRLTGTLALAPSAKNVRIIDGIVPMNATYRLDASYVETLKVRPLAAWGRRDIPAAAE
jgi:hypothetical protein